MLHALFHNTTTENLHMDEVIELIKSFISQDTSSSYVLTIGTDSEIKKSHKDSSMMLELVTAIAIYRKGFGGKYFWTKQKMPQTKTLRDKIYQEVLLSLEMASVFVPNLQKILNGQSKLYNLEIHIDVGEKGETRDVIREVVGMVVGSGYVAKTKPYSYAASNIADKYA